MGRKLLLPLHVDWKQQLYVEGEVSTDSPIGSYAKLKVIYGKPHHNVLYFVSHFYFFPHYDLQQRNEKEINQAL